VLYVLFSCQSDPGRQSLSQMEFTVDSSRLAPLIKDRSSGLQYCPPAGWVRALPASFRSCIDTSYYGSLPQTVNVFKDSASTAFLVVSVYPGETGNVGDLNQYRLNQQSPWQDARKARFEHHQMLFGQLLLQSPRWVSFRLFIQRENRPVRFDYFVSRSVYQNEVRKIESSIGSINTLSSFN